MESPSPDLSSVPMSEEAGASLLRSPMDVSHQPDLSEDQMDRKENLCVVSEDNVSMLALPKETTMTKKRSTRGGGNLRKSLAWNQAFFTEEGVLDTLELSLIARSSTKPSVNLLSVNEMSPLSTYSKCSIRPPLHDLEANTSSRVHKKSQNNIPKGRKLFPSINESEVHVNSGKTPSAKGVPRSILRLPAMSSQKRVASVSTTNPTSKLQKFMPTKTHAATLPSSASNVMLATKGSKSEHSVPKVNAGLGAVTATITKNNSGCPTSSSKLSAADHSRKTNSQLNNGPTNSKVIPKHLSSSKLNETITSGPVKAASSMSQGTNNVHGGSAPVHARPSALRMPSPSLGFFCQGKASPSYDNQSRRPTQPAKSKVSSLKKPIYLKRDGELRHLPSNGQQLTKISAAIKSGAGTGISNSSVPFPAANFLRPPPATSETCSSMEVNVEMKRADGIDKRAAVMLGSSQLQKDGQELSASHQLLDHNNDNQPQAVSSGKSNPDGLQEASDGGRSSESSNAYFAEGIQHSVKPNVVEQVQSACSSTRGFSGSEVLCSSTSSEIGFSKELKEHEAKEIQEGDSGSENMCIQSHVNVTLNKTYPVSSEEKQSAENFDSSDQRYGFTVRNIDCDAPLEAKESLNQRTYQIASACLSSHVQLDDYSTKISSKPLQAAITGSICVTSGVYTAFSEEFEPSLLQDSELQDGRPQCDSRNGISSIKEALSTPVESISRDKTNQGVPLGAVPFSDEWLAAVEAFGEDILEKKTGRVQNSPRDKASPEPGPWSLVKRKAQEIGPYDCTKYSKNNEPA